MNDLVPNDNVPRGTSDFDETWAVLRTLTPARVALGRAGSGLPTRAHLDFQLAHARARDAVHAHLDIPAFRARLGGDASVAVHSAAADRAEYLKRPDLGRQLDAASAESLGRVGGSDVASIVIADGLSALAVDRHAPGIVSRLTPALTAAGWRLAPIVIVQHGRVAIGDEIGERLGAAAVVVLIGERPGLSAPDSLGAYFTFAPRVGRTDADRNCVSNIRPEGLSLDLAAAQIAWLFAESRRRQRSGVAIRSAASPPIGPTP
ncbi:MAG TPA: ethanolamine ammonia-lyase subunit EutC [Gemmatimonadaceae bacterium]|nr:ethanolamine ammonia-lyase subunit EutC [Gemmatimonadaceae bacterium]